MSLASATYGTDDISGVASFTEAANGVATLYVHRDVERTVDYLTSACHVLNGIHGMGRDLINRLGDLKVTVGRMLDPDDVLIDALGDIADLMSTKLPVLVSKKLSVDGDARLSAGHCDMLHASYDEMIRAYANLIETIKDVRAALITHDMEAATPCETVFASVDELVAYLRRP